MHAVLPRRLWPCCIGAVLLVPTLCFATEVRVVAITQGRSADVVIEQRQPITIDVGQTVDGVKVLRVGSSSAVVSVDGITKTLPLVANTSGGHATGSGSGSVTLAADARGQFSTTGAVNGRPVQFIVDTGATVVALSQSEARRIGLEYRGGKSVVSATANGAVRGWLVSLGSVRVGDVTVRDVEGIVIENDMSTVLLGMSFLGRFDMHRQGSTLVLRRSGR